MGFVVDKLVWGQVFLTALIILSVLFHSHISCIYHQHCMISEVNIVVI
jgi:hypothetical protein